VNASNRLAPADQRREPAVCRRCAEIGSTCCVLPPGNEEHGFPVSAMERRRIEETLGLDRGAFTLGPNSGAFRAGLYGLFPTRAAGSGRVVPGRTGPCASVLRHPGTVHILAFLRLPLAKAVAAVLLPPLPVLGRGSPCDPPGRRRLSGPARRARSGGDARAFRTVPQRRPSTCMAGCVWPGGSPPRKACPSSTPSRARSFT